MAFPFGKSDFEISTPVNARPARRSYGTAIREMFARRRERKQTSQRRHAVTVEAMEPRILLSADPIFAHVLADGGDYTLGLMYDDTADLYRIQLTNDIDGLVVASSDLDGVNEVQITGTSDADKLTVDLLFRPDPAFKVTFDGGDGADELIIDGPKHTSVTYDLGANGTGTITQSEGGTDHVRDFLNVELVTDQSAAESRTINDVVSGRGGSIVIGDNDVKNDGLSRITMGPDASKTVLDFAKPALGGAYGSGALDINIMDGNDDIRFEGLDQQLTDAATELDAAGNPDVVARLIAGGNAELTGPQADVTWYIIGQDRAYVDGLFVSGVDTLTGADNNDDTFYFELNLGNTFADGGVNDPWETIDLPGRWSGEINGGAGGTDIIVQQGAVFSGPMAGSTGSATINFETFNYIGMEPTITVGGTVGDDDFTLRATGTGAFEIIDGSGARFGGFTFNAGAPLVVNLGFGDDTFSLGAGLTGWSGSLTVRGDFGGDVIYMENDLNTRGGDIEMDAELIVVDGAVVDTRLLAGSVGSHGDILLEGGGSGVSSSRFAGIFSGDNPFENGGAEVEGAGIVIGGGAQLLAADVKGNTEAATAGNVTITVDAGFALDALAFTPGLNEKIAAAAIQIGNAVIRAGELKISATADSSKAVEIEIDVDALLGLPDDGSAEGDVEDGDVPLLVGGIQLAANELESAIQQQFDNLPVLGALTKKIPVHFMRAEAIAKVDLLDGLDVWAETSIDVDANATSELTFTNPGMNFGFTFGESDATAMTTVEGTVTLDSGGLVSIAAAAENTLDVATNIQSGLVFKAKKSTTTGAKQKRIKGPAIAVTLGDATTAATTDIGADAIISADDITISADTSTKQSVGTSSKIVQPQSNQGTAIGITVAFLDNQATAQVAGDLNATDTVTVKANAVNEETLLSTKASTKAKPSAADQGAAGAAKQQITGQASGLAGKWGGPGQFGLSAGVIVSENVLGAHALVLDGAVIEAETLDMTARVEDNFRTTAIGGSKAGAAVSLAGAVNVSQFDNDATVRIDAATVTVGALVMSAEAIIPNQVDLLDEIPALGAAFSDLGASLGAMPSLSNAFGTVWGSIDVEDPAATRGALADVQTAFTSYYDESLGPALTGVTDSITPFLGYLTPTGGLPNKVATSYVAASAAAGGGGPNGPEGKFALNGSVNIMLIENKATAGIGAGALVTVTGDAGATIESNATVETVDIVGIPNIKALFKGSTKSDGSAMGGAFSYVAKHNEADSYIADGATVDVTKDLMVDAVTRQFVFNVTDAGGSGDDLNFQGSISINDHTNNARAWIEDGAKVSADNITVNADHSATMLSFGLSLAKGGSTGIGISSAVNIANNVTLATIGDVVSDTIPTGFDAGVTAAGDVNVTADSTNLGLTVAFAGAKPDSGGPAPDPADNAPAAAPTQGDVTVTESAVDVAGKAGLGISGAIGINIINQHTEATIADTDVAVGGDLLVHAMTQAPVVSVSMPVTLITGSSGSGSNTGIAGGLSVTKFDRDTIAQIVSGTVTMTGNGDVTVEAETRSETVAVVVGGSGGSQSDTAIAGSVNVTIADDNTFAAIGAGATVLNAKDVAVTAHDNAISVTVAGAAADGNKTGVGAAFDIGIYNDTVESRIDGTVTSTSDVTVAASNFSVLVSVAASLGSADTGLGLAGSVGVNYVDSDVTAEIGGTVTANGSVGVFATDQLIAVSIVGAVGKGTTGIGIAPGVLVVDHDTRAALTSTANVTARGFGAGLNYFGGTGYGLTVAADTDDKLFMVAAAGAKGDTTALAGSVGSINVLGTTEATIEDNARVNDDGNASTIATGGSSVQDVTVAAQAQSLQITATGGAAKGGSTAIGAAFGITTMDRDVIASVGTGAFIEARRDLLVHADSRDTIITFAVGGSQSDSFAGAGSLSLGVLDRTTTAFIDGTVRVGGNVSVSADARLNAAMIAGSIAISSSAGAVGISAAPLITINNTSAEIRGNADINANADNTTVVSTLEGNRSIRGVDVAANDRIVSVAAAISGSTSSGGFQGAGAFSGAFLFGTEQVIDGSNPVPSLEYENPSATGNASVTQALVMDGARVTTSGNLSLSANTAATVVAITGAVAAGGGSSGIGLSGTVVARKSITQAVIGAAEIHADALRPASALADDGDTRSVTGVDVSADSDLVIVALTVGGAGSSGFSGAGAITVIVTDDVTRASLLAGADVTTGGNLTIGSDSDLILTFGSGAVAIGSSGGIGASVAVAVTLSKTVAEIAEGATVLAMANGAASNIPDDEGTRAVRGVDLYADSFFVVAGLTVAGSGGNGIAGSGTINVVVQTDETRASIGALEALGSGDPAFAVTSVTTGDGNVTLEADSDAIIVPLSGAIAGGSGPAFGATIVTLSRIAETTALIGGGAMITAGTTNATVITDSGSSRTIRGVDLVATSSPVLVATGIAGAIGGGGAAAGVIAVVTSDEDVTAMVRDATLNTDGNVTLFADTARGRDGISDQDLKGAIIEPVTSAVIVAGGGAIGGGSGVGVGATIGTVIVTHDVSAKITNSTVTANAQRGATDRGITALATRTATGVDVVAQSDMFAAALTVAGGASDSVGVAGAFSNVTAIRTTEAQINASTVTTNGNATILADSDATLETLAGGVAGGGAVGVGVGAAVTYHSDTTEASVQGNGTLIARGIAGGTYMPTGSELGGAKVLNSASGLAVSAVSDQTIITGAVGAGASGNIGVAGTAAVSVQEEYTRAWIGAGAVVSDDGAGSAQDATVLARDNGTIITTGGAVGIGATGGGAAGVGVQVTTKETQAWIAGQVTVKDDIAIRALSSDEGVVVSASGAGGAYGGLAGSASVVTINNTTQATVRSTASLTAGDSIAINALDETSLDVVAGAIAGALGAGAGSGGVTVIDKSTKTEVEGGATLLSLGAGSGVKTLTGGVGITFGADDTDANDVNVSGVGQVDLSKANSEGFADGGATGERIANLSTGTHGGIHVQAVSTDRVETISFNLAGGAGAVALGGTANVFLNETKTLIGVGASLTTTENGDDISVGAASDAYALNVMAAVAVGGSAGAPGASAAVFGNSTEVRMTGATVRSAGDFTLTASGTDDALAITIAVGGGAGVGVGASANAIVVTSDVTAAIDGGSDITADYNVAVAANHTTDIDAIGGAVGVGGTGAGGAAVNVIVIEKTTDAYIGGSSIVTANAAVGSANMTVADGGLTGTNDTYDDGDRASTVAVKGAAITATSTEDVFVIGAAGAASGFVGAAGAVGVIVVDSDTSAYLGNSARLTSGGSAVISATNKLDLFSGNGGVSLALAGGAAGAVSVVVVRSDTSAYTTSGTVLTTTGTGAVIVGAAEIMDIDVIAVSGAATAGIGLAASVSVVSLGNDLTSEQSGELSGGGGNSLSLADDASSTSWTNSVLGGFSSTGDADGVDGTGTPSAASRLASATDGAKDTVNSKAGATSATAGLSTPPVTTKGTDAFIAGTVNAGGNVDVRANERIDLGTIAGAVAVGLGGAGAGVSVANINRVATASIDATGRVKAGLSGPGTVDVMADMRVNADATSAVGAGGLIGALGASVTIHDDSAGAKAEIDGHVTDADSVNVKAFSERDVDLSSTEATIGAIAGGASVTEASIGGTTEARTGNTAVIGTGTSGGVGTFLLEADSEINAKVEGTSISAGIGSGGVNSMKVVVTGTVRADVNGSTISTSGSATVRADSDVYSEVVVGSIKAAGIALGKSIARSSVTTDVTAQVRGSADLDVGALNVTADAVHEADATATSSAGAAISVTGVESYATVGGTITASLGGSGLTVDATSVTVEAIANMDADADARGITGGALSVGGALAQASVSTALNALIGSGRVTSTGNVDVYARHNAERSGAARADAAGDLGLGASAKSQASSGGLIAGGETKAVAFDSSNVSAKINGGAVSGNNVTVASVSVGRADADASSVVGGLAAKGTSTAGATMGGSNLAAVQSADITSTGTLSVRSIDSVKSEATARAGGGGLLAGVGAEAVAITTRSVQALITGNSNDIISADSVRVLAQSKMQSNAVTSGTVIGAVALGDSKSTATTTATVNATISGATVTATVGDVDVDALFNTNDTGSAKTVDAARAHATTSAGGLGAASNSKVNATSTVNITAGFGDYASVMAADDIDALARAFNEADSKSNNNSTGLISGGKAEATSSATTNARGTLGTGASLTANDIAQIKALAIGELRMAGVGGSAGLVAGAFAQTSGALNTSANTVTGTNSNISARDARLLAETMAKAVADVTGNSGQKLTDTLIALFTGDFANLSIPSITANGGSVSNVTGGSDSNVILGNNSRIDASNDVKLNAQNTLILDIDVAMTVGGTAISAGAAFAYTHFTTFDADVILQDGATVLAGRYVDIDATNIIAGHQKATGTSSVDLVASSATGLSEVAIGTVGNKAEARMLMQGSSRIEAATEIDIDVNGYATDFNGATGGDALVVTGKAVADAAFGATADAIGIGKAYGKSVVDMHDDAVMVTRSVDIDGSSDLTVDEVANADASSPIVEFVETLVEVVKKVTKWLPWPLDKIVEWVTETVLKIVRVVTFLEENASVVTIGDTADDVVDLRGSIYLGDGQDKLLHVLADGSISAESNVGATITGNTILVDDIINDAGGKLDIRLVRGVVSGDADIYLPKLLNSVRLINDTARDLHVQRVDMISDNGGEPDINIIDSRPAPADIVPGFNIKNAGGDYTEFTIRNNVANTASDVLFLNDISNVAAIYDFYVAGGNIDQASGVDLIAGDAGEMFATMKLGVLVPAVTIITDLGNIGSVSKNFEVELVRGRDFANGDISHTPITMVAHAGNDVNLTVQGTNITLLSSTATTQVADDIRLDLSAGNDVNFTGNAGKLTTILTTDVGGGNFSTVATNYTVEAAYQILNASSTNGDVRLLANGLSSMAVASVTAQNGLARIEAGGSLSDLTGTTVKNITAKDVTLISRLGSIGSVGNALDIDSSNASAGLVNATALNGAITLNETSGDMRIGTIRAGGAVTLSGAGSLVDGASDAAADVIGSAVTLRASSGTIGTALDRLELDTARLDVATARAVYLTEVSGDFVAGDVDATAGDAVLRAAAGNLRVDSVYASGDATLLSDTGAVLDDTASTVAAIRADSITINAAATIGTSTNALEIDSAFSGAGQVNATAGQGIWLTETANAMTIASIVSGNGPVVLNGPGDLVLLANGLIQATAGTVAMTATGAIRSGNDSEIRASGEMSFSAANLTTGAGSLIQGGQITADVGGDVSTGVNSTMTSTSSVGISAGGAVTTGAGSSMTAVTAATISGASLITGADSSIQGQSISITTIGAMTTGTDSVIAATNGASINVGATLSTGASSSISAGGALNVQAATLIHGVGALMSAASVTANVSGSVTMLHNAQIRATGNATINAGGDMTLEDGAIVEALSVDLSVGDVATFKAGSTVRAGEALTISSDDVLLQNADALFEAGTSMIIAIDLTDRDATGGTMVLQGALSAPSILMIGGQENDSFTVNVQTIDGNTLLLGGAGDDTIFLDRLPSMTTVRDGLRDSFTVDGQAGSDDVRIDLTGTSDVLISVSDSGNPGDGIDTMSINTTTDNDTVLVRSNFIALLQDDGAGGYNAALERINYDQTINARVRIDTGLGDDLIVLDDNSAMMTIDAGEGNDTFQVGQIFGTSRTDPNVAPGDEIDTVLTTLGLLSRGISQATVLYGGVGNDTFRVYSNHAELRMEGEAGNDAFLMRAFLLQDNTGISLVGQTQLNAGAGDDEVRYNINAPVDIDGGAGFDRVIAVGSEGDDVFLVTKDGVFGAGLSISLSGVEESLEVDGLEGDDTFYIQSTNPDAITTIIGGLGSDTFNVGGSVLKPIISASSGGQTGIINHIANADPITDGGFASLLAQGVNILVKPVDPATPVVITTSGSDTSVREGDGLFDTYTLRMPALPADAMSRAWITVSGALPSSSQPAGARGVLVSLDGVTWSEQLVVAFESADWNAERTIYVKAADDTAEEGNTTAIISHSIISTDADLNGARIGNVSVEVGDDDAAEIVITQTNGGTRAIEGGTDDTIGVTLSRALEVGEVVTVTLDAGAGAGLSANTLTFTETNWNIAQIVTVSALDDTAQTGNQSVTIGATSTSTGSFDARLAEITAELVDDETASVIITETNGSTVVGEGQTDSYTLQLSSQPIGTVTVTLQNDGQTTLTSADARFAGNTVTFDATNWDQPITIDVAMAAGLAPVDPANPIMTVSASPHRVDAVQGPLLLTGGVGPENRSIVAAVILPTEFDIPPTQPTPSTDDTGDVDRVNVFSDGTSEQTIGTLTSNNISGLGMGGSLTIDQGEDGIENLVTYAGGITYQGMDIVEVMLGRGNDIFTVESTAEGTITAIHGGGGDDHLTALDHTGPLVIYGDTSATGQRYSSSIAGVSENAFAFPADGNDLIDISATTTTVVVDAGGGNDMILGGAGGDHIAAGGGDDTVVAGLGVDHIYGDGRFEVDLVTRVTTTYEGVVGNDDLLGGDGDDVIFGDNGRIIQPGLFKVLGTAGATFITSAVPGVGGSDTIDGENGADIILGGAADDTIHSGTGVDVVFGDFGEVIVSAGVLVQARSIDTDKTTGGSDTITGGTEGDFVIGGAANDVIDGEQGADVIFGDHGALTWTDGLLTLAISTGADETTGGADAIIGGSEGDIIVGGSAGDLISGIDGADLIFGDHAEVILAGGLLVSAHTRAMDLGDGGADTILGGDGDDVIMGGEAGDTIFGGDGNDAIIGDGGEVEYESGGQVIKLFRTTTEGLGDDDTIRSGNGDDFVLAGFGADDVNAGEGGDLILGDNGLIVLSGGNLLTVETTATTLGGIDQIVAGNGNDAVLGGTEGDNIDAGDGDDLVFGDFGKLLFAGGALARATSTDTVEGGADTITLGAGNDIALGGADGDMISGGIGMDIILGDAGIIIRDADGDVTSLDAVHTIAPVNGGDDEIDSGDGNDVVFGGTGADQILTGMGNDLAFGDHGGIERLVDGAIDLSQLPLTTAAALPFSFTSRDIGVNDGGAGDRIIMGLGDDIAVGGQGGDWISGGDGQDDLIGGHTICEGADGDDAIDAGAGDDVVAGDNAEILRRDDTLDQRTRALLGDTLYTIDPQTGYFTAGYVANVDTVWQTNLNGSQGRDIRLLDHSENADPSTWGDDLIAGGADADRLFGQRGNDTILGDGAIDFDALGGPIMVEAGALTDSNDYVEGGGGSDTLIGGLGQDDLIGGSSMLFLGESCGDPTGERLIDDADTIFGGTSLDISRNSFGVDGDGQYARDADVILGDNGTIYRIVADGASLNYEWDITGTETTERVDVRAVEYLAYTPGGATSDIGGGDTIHGEAGNDIIHGQSGDDFIYGGAQDDDIIGGAGNDWISGGTGNDGILGDDGKILTSRNGWTESLIGLTVARVEQVVTTNASAFHAILNPLGDLNKTVDLEPWDLGGDDLIYGGLGDDFLHGGAGNDGISGAEALAQFYTQPSDWRPTIDPATGRLVVPDGYYDKTNALTRIDGFVLDFDPTEGELAPMSREWAKGDGDDKIFGDIGHDWLMGGTGRDHMWGGLGGDILNLDDDLSTSGADAKTTPISGYGDLAYGGGGRDLLIANTSHDRMVDWAGEYNEFVVPFAPNGAWTIVRAPAPWIVDHLLAVAESDGADPTRSAFGDSDQMGEPYGEIGLADQDSGLWQDNTGSPFGQQSGNIGGGKRDGRGIEPAPQATDPTSRNFISEPSSNVETMSFDAMTLASEPEGGEGWITEETASLSMPEGEGDMPAPDAVIVVSAPANDDTAPDALDLEANGTTGHNVDWDWAPATTPATEDDAGTSNSKAPAWAGRSGKAKGKK
ncbi:LEPR-XLL domain-containing protein [uncultured Litoreibacter sp.]|uniref:LEPR-XLL domain-containing protein n=1 Tax=uncultured Litoreibacter sp. TaxID=1392394 RepID=UPI00260DB6B7|nr:LEPR-XLL domain-containing protein [uncultured Litoreibacter sp.]